MSYFCFLFRLIFTEQNLHETGRKVDAMICITLTAETILFKELKINNVILTTTIYRIKAW